jgi:hypothetical protein
MKTAKMCLIGLVLAAIITLIWQYDVIFQTKTQYFSMNGE